MDNKFRKPRVWSNKILKELAHYFKGDIVNISGWRDEDKEGKKYRDYFTNLDSYSISNFVSEARGFQGNLENEFFLDLQIPLDDEYKDRFDVVFNHTVLEHVFEVNQAFENLCSISKDIVIIVVPFLQEQHADYGDFWRFTPLTMEKLFKKYKKDMIYLNYNDHPGESIYVFAIGSSEPSKWKEIIGLPSNKLGSNSFIGINHIKNTFLTKVLYKLGILK
jgi:hypothetical protein